MVYGAFISTSGQTGERAQSRTLPKFPKYTYYFGIRFPSQASFVAGQLSGWLWTTGAVVLVVLFFGYTLVVVLQQRRLTDVQRDFINNITHELQTPVSTIRIAADVLQSDTIAQQPDRLRQYARIVQEESKRLQKQVGTILQLARSERSGFAPDRTDVNLHEMMQTAATHFAPHVSLNLTATNAHLLADRYQLETLLNNLIDNAIKYSPNQPQVVLHTRREVDRLIWSVSDTGIGIAPAYQKAVFRQFFRVPTGHTHDTKGFGLGLYYVWQVARAHGWRLSLTSQPGQGSTFTISHQL